MTNKRHRATTSRERFGYIVFALFTVVAIIIFVLARSCKDSDAGVLVMSDTTAHDTVSVTTSVSGTGDVKKPRRSRKRKKSESSPAGKTKKSPRPHSRDYYRTPDEE